MVKQPPATLIPCPLCAHQVSSIAGRCPNCAHPVYKARPLVSGFTVLGLTVCFFALSIFYSILDDTPPAPDQLKYGLIAGFGLGLLLIGLGGVITLLRYIKARS